MRAPTQRFFAIVVLSAAVYGADTSTTVNVKVGNQVNTQVGVNGRLEVAMSTSFQLAEWSYQFFQVAPQAQAPLASLFPFHTRVQAISKGIPLTAADAWDFTELDAMFPPVQAVSDHSPELQIATAPAFLNDSSGHILPSSFGSFAQMSTNLVRYYNTGGFDSAGKHFQSPTPYPVTLWGIFNEPNGNGLAPEQYANLYNTVVPLMAQADPAIKFVAVELSDYGTQAESFLPGFMSNVTARVDAAATHFYSSCNQKDLDADVLATVPGFAGEVRYFYSQLAAKPSLAGVPVWVTENNVNADYDAGNGMSNCNPGTPFVLDQRGTSPFFAGWRSLVFATLGEAGAQALYHWSFGTDAQYGEIDGSGNPYLSYWVDYYLSHWLPSPPGQDILQVNSSGCCLWIYKNQNPFGLDTHTLAARNVDGSVVILMSNHAIQTPLKDNNGPGAPRTFALDLSALGTFTSATLVTLDAATPRTGPAPAALAPSAQMNVTLQGYGAAFLRLANAQPALPPTGILNAASYASGSVSPGEIVALFGSAIGPANPTPLILTNPRLIANSVAGLRVLFDGVPAPILYAAAGQVNAVAPYSVAGRSSTQIQVEYLGGLSRPVTVPVAPATPGIFTLDATGKGPGAILNVKDESINSAENPAAPGDWVSIFATGAGTTTPPGVDGLLAAAPLPQADAGVTVTIGGQPCEINYTGAAPGFVEGLLQVNAQIPPGVTPGDAVPVAIAIGGVLSQAGVTLAVR